MTKKSYDNSLTEIAEPVVKNLIEQAIQARKFRMRFPAFFECLLKGKEQIREALSQRLFVVMEKYNPSASEDELNMNVATILNDRRFLDHAIGFIQTGRLLVADEFLVQHKILSANGITKLFEIMSKGFWSYVFHTKKFEDIYILRHAVLSYLTQHNLYLPDLLPNYTIEVLLSDFLPIYLQYSRFESTPEKISATNDDHMRFLNPLFRHNSPLYMLSSYTHFKPDLSPELESEYHAVLVSLDEQPQNLAYILRDFLLQYKSRRMDRMRKGTSNSYDFKSQYEIKKISEISRSLIKVLDEFTHSRIGNARPVHTFSYRRVLSALIGLYYFDQHFQHTFGDENLARIDEIHARRIPKNNLDCIGNGAGEANIFKDFMINREPLSKRNFMYNLKEALELSDLLVIRVSPNNHRNLQITDIKCFFKEIDPDTGEGFICREIPEKSFSSDSVKKNIDNFLEGYIPEARVFIQF